MIAPNPQHREAMALCHHLHAAEAFHAAWLLWKRPFRTADQQRDMLLAAHACAEHWALAGDRTDRCRAELLCARIHAAAGRIAAARIHGRRVVRLVSSHRLDRALAIEAYRTLAEVAERAGEAEEHQHLLHLLALVQGSHGQDEQATTNFTGY